MSITVAGWNDPDADAPEYKVEWRVNGTVVPGENGLMLPVSRFSRGDRVKAIVTPANGSDLGNAVETNEVTIGNLAPQVTSVSFAGSAPYHTASLLSVLANGMSDADGDTISLQVRWFVNGSELVEHSPFLVETSRSSRAVSS